MCRLLQQDIGELQPATTSKTSVLYVLGAREGPCTQKTFQSLCSDTLHRNDVVHYDDMFRSETRDFATDPFKLEHIVVKYGGLVRAPAPAQSQYQGATA